MLVQYLLRLLRSVLLHVLLRGKLRRLLCGLLHLHGVHHLLVMVVVQLLLSVHRRLQGKTKGKNEWQI